MLNRHDRRLVRIALAMFLGTPIVGVRDASAQKISSKAQAQIDSVRRAVARFVDPQAAEDAGFQPVFGLVPLQGVHYVKPELVRNGSFELTQPSVLMYAPVNL